MRPTSPPAPADPRAAWRDIATTLFASALVWSVAQWLVQPNLDRYHDMLESFAWSQTFEWGSFKHPPFFAWVTRLWFALAPQTDLAFKLLAYTNVAIGLAGVAMLARLAGLGQQAHSAVVLLFWCLPYTTLAAKFNANAQLLSVWPWAAAALFGSLLRSGRAGFAWSTLLGLTCAAAMLSKYYSGVLLLALFIAAIAHPQRLQWFISPRPWWALAVTLIALAPHLMWLKASDFAMLSYALDQGGGQTNWSMTLRFALAPFFYWAPGWVACVLIIVIDARRRGQRACVAASLLGAWRPTGWSDSLFWLAFTPWAVSLAFGLAGVVELSTPWAIPIGFAFPLLWLRNLATAGHARALAHIASIRLIGSILLVVLAASIALAVGYARIGQRDYVRPTEALAQAIEADWRSHHPGQRLGWTGGAWPETAMMAFYVDRQIRALPGTPDSREASLAPHLNWSRENGVLICPYPRADAANIDRCAERMRDWLKARGLDDSPRTIRAQRVGWRFPQPVTQSVLVFDVPPSEGRPR